MTNPTGRAAQPDNRLVARRDPGTGIEILREHSTGHDAVNREVFRAGDPASLDLVGLALHGPKKTVDKAVKGLPLHA